MRQAEGRDLDALYRISLATGHEGGDASPLYADPKLIGQIYMAPYVRLAPRLTLILEDQDGVAGFLVGALDTNAWEERLEREWWPSLRVAHPDPRLAGPEASWTPDQRRADIIHRPRRTPVEVARRYPSHLHLNLLPRAQRLGNGSKMVAHWWAEHRVGAAHVGVNKANEGGLAFWRGQGFHEVKLTSPPLGRTIWLGRGS